MKAQLAFLIWRTASTPEEYHYDHGPWKQSSEAMAEIETALRAILLRAGRAYPERIKPYLERACWDGNVCARRHSTR